MYERVANLVTIPKKERDHAPSRARRERTRSEPLPPISRAPRGGGRVKAISYDIAPACGDAQIRSMPIYGNSP